MEARQDHNAGAFAQNAPCESVRELAALLQKSLPQLDIKLAVDSCGFASRGAKPWGEGVTSVHGELHNDSVIAVAFELLECPSRARLRLGKFLELVSELDEKCRLARPQEPPPEEQAALWVSLEVAATPLSLTRQDALMGEVERLNGVARSLQAEMPRRLNPDRLDEQYKGLGEHLQPVHPWEVQDGSDQTTLREWAGQVQAFLQGGASVALVSPYAVARELSLAVLASVTAESGRSLGLTVSPRINAATLIQIVEKAPGTVAVPGSSISLGSNAYEMSNEMRSLLRVLSSRGRPAVFTGSFSELQSLFSGGQGGSTDPLRPIVRRVPRISTEALADFTVYRAAAGAGGIGESKRRELAGEVLEALEGLGPETQKRILPMVAVRRVRTWMAGQEEDEAVQAYAATIAGFKETLGGLGHETRASRAPAVQSCFARRLTDPQFLGMLQDRLLGQDRALAELAERLRMECLTRPSHQPFRYCAQGTPGTGKSESAVLLARHLEVPYINIDAASMPDYYTASAQLLGSGRGIVGSYKSGRLEQAAKHHRGAVVEVSDLDHARPAVRSCLADLFLQILETGEGQTATGAMFSCANLILAFTVNLPEGKDEQIHRPLGFCGTVSREQATAQVNTEIKRMLSSAFLSRIGSPILFGPLDAAALAQIVDRTVTEAARRAAGQLGGLIEHVETAPALGRRVVENLASDLLAFGARGVVERARSLTTEALMRARAAGTLPGSRALILHANADGTLSIEPKRGEDPDA